jgi:hypothetical protein
MMEAAVLKAESEVISSLVEESKKVSQEVITESKK